MNFSILGVGGERISPLQNMSLWHKNYLELIQKKLNYLNLHIGQGTCTKNRGIATDNFLPKKLSSHNRAAFIAQAYLPFC